MGKSPQLQSSDDIPQKKPIQLRTGLLK